MGNHRDGEDGSKGQTGPDTDAFVRAVMPGQGKEAPPGSPLHGIPATAVPVAGSVAAAPAPPEMRHPDPPAEHQAEVSWDSFSQEQRDAAMLKYLRRVPEAFGAQLVDLSPAEQALAMADWPAEVRAHAMQHGKKIAPPTPRSHVQAPAPASATAAQAEKKICPVCKHSAPTKTVEGRTYFNPHGPFGPSQFCPGMGKEAKDPLDEEEARQRRQRQVKKKLDAEEEQAEDYASVDLVRAEDVKVRKVEWLWYARLLRRGIALLEGPPEKGKSTILTDLAARESCGHSFPGDEKGHEPGCVVMLVAEDDLETTVKPRLIAAGADLTRVHFLGATRDDAGELVPFQLSDDCDRLGARCREVGATLVVVDPLVSYLGSRTGKAVETGNDMQVRKALLPLKDMAEDVGASVVAVRHYRKGRGTDAIEAGGGSIAFSALARVLLSALQNPEDTDSYLFSVAKNNLVARDKRPAIAYKIVPSRHDPDIGCIEWGTHVARSTEEILSALAEKAKRTHTIGDRAAEWLAKRLAGGAVPRAVVIEEGTKAGFSESALKRGAEKVGVISESSAGFPRVTSWSLPPEEM